MQPPKISTAFIAGPAIKVTFLNRPEGMTGTLYRAVGMFGVPQLLDTIDADEYTDTDGIDPEGIYVYLASYDNAPETASIAIVADHSTAEPVGYYDVAAKPPASFGADVPDTFSFGPFGSITMNFAQVVDYIEEGFIGNEAVAIGDNQTL